MNNLTENELNEKYKHLFGVIAGYLPQEKSALHDWQENLLERINKSEVTDTDYNPAVKKLKKLIDENGIVRMYVEQMIDQVPRFCNRIGNVDQLLKALNLIIQEAPKYYPKSDPRRNFFPMSSLFVDMMFTPAGEAIFRNDKFNEAIKQILKEWCRFLDSSSSASVLNENKDGWLCSEAVQEYELEQFIFDKDKPHWGWTSYNDFFHREIKLDYRPLGAGIVSANDGTVYKIAHDVKKTDKFWIKEQLYSLVNMLDNSKHTDAFVGGHVFQSFLSGANYHRWRAPVAGIVKEARVVEGLMFSEAESAGYDPDAGVLSQGYGASVNTRGLVLIESEEPDIGMVYVIPIGITEISSVHIKVKEGQKVKKGDELGHFSYGGSTLCLVFQKNSTIDFTVKEKDVIKVRQQIATLKTGRS